MLLYDKRMVWVQRSCDALINFREDSDIGGQVFRLKCHENGGEVCECHPQCRHFKVIIFSYCVHNYNWDNAVHLKREQATY